MYESKPFCKYNLTNYFALNYEDKIELSNPYQST